MIKSIFGIIKNFSLFHSYRLIVFPLFPERCSRLLGLEAFSFWFDCLGSSLTSWSDMDFEPKSYFLEAGKALTCPG